MKNLKNIKKAVLEMASLLAQDKTLCRLLLNDTADALTKEAPTYDLNYLIQNNYISMLPPVENRIEEYQRNTFLSLLVDSVFLNSVEDNMKANVIIYVSTDESHMLLDNNNNRLLEMSDRVISVLNNKKLSAAGQVTVSSMARVMLSEFHPAYRIALSFTDQHNGNGEI